MKEEAFLIPHRINEDHGDHETSNTIDKNDDDDYYYYEDDATRFKQEIEGTLSE